MALSHTQSGPTSRVSTHNSTQSRAWMAQANLTFWMRFASSLVYHACRRFELKKCKTWSTRVAMRVFKKPLSLSNSIIRTRTNHLQATKTLTWSACRGRLRLTKLSATSMVRRRRPTRSSLFFKASKSTSTTRTFWSCKASSLKSSRCALKAVCLWSKKQVALQHTYSRNSKPLWAWTRKRWSWPRWSA